MVERAALRSGEVTWAGRAWIAHWRGSSLYNCNIHARSADSLLQRAQTGQKEQQLGTIHAPCS
jgi:hypothetical protein